MFRYKTPFTAAVAGFFVAGLALSGCEGGGNSASGELAGNWCALDDPAGRKANEACPSPTDAQTYPAELVLPMPCGRAMVFRKVAFKTSNVLDDERAFLGSAIDPTQDPSGAAMSGPWLASIGGSFLAPVGGAWESFYYIGKYEVTEPQFAVFKEGAFDKSSTCGKVAETVKGIENGKVTPAVNVTWQDSAAFADAYTRWLLTKDKAKRAAGKPMAVPWQEAAPGYLRLPTEAEWEFAARGGSAPAALQASQVYEVYENGVARMPAVDEIAFIRGAQTEPAPGKRVFYVGRRLPNRLGLYDMVGNAEELAFDVFRPTRPDAIVGRYGGAVAHGGSADESENVIGVGRRREIEMYDADGAVRTPVTGFRLVIAAPFFVNKRSADFKPMAGNREFDDDLKLAQQALLDAGVGSANGARAEALAEVAILRASGQTQDLENRLAVIEASLRRANAEANTQDRETFEKLFEGTVLSAVNIRYVRFIAEYGESQLNQLEQETSAQDPEVRKRIDSARTLISARRADERANFQYYLENVAQLSRLSTSELESISTIVKDRLSRRELQRPTQQVETLLSHIREVQAAGGVVPRGAFEKWRAAFD